MSYMTKQGYNFSNASHMERLCWPSYFVRALMDHALEHVQHTNHGELCPPLQHAKAKARIENHLICGSIARALKEPTTLRILMVVYHNHTSTIIHAWRKSSIHDHA